MKKQYLGDSKDCFKWDYHDYLTVVLNYPLLNIVLMLTPDDESGEGKTSPSRFPARSEVIDFCKDLRGRGSIKAIQDLPKITGSNYTIKLHKENIFISNNNRDEYFSSFSAYDKQIVFIDPDNGFEPEKRYNNKHVRYCDIASLLGQISDDSMISVFQHFRRKHFAEDFKEIKERLMTNYITAIYWHSLMFVTISKSQNIIDSIRKANIKYSSDIALRSGNNPVTVIS